MSLALSLMAVEAMLNCDMPDALLEDLSKLCSKLSKPGIVNGYTIVLGVVRLLILAPEWVLLA